MAVTVFQMAAIMVPAIGPLIGAYIALKAGEEIRHGKVLLSVLCHMLIAGLLFFVLSQWLSTVVAAVAAFAVGALLTIVDVRAVKPFIPAPSTMILLAFLVFTLMRTPDMPVAASIAFVYAVTVGSLATLSDHWKHAANYSLYLGVSLALMLVFIQF